MISVVNDMLEMLTAPYPKIRCSACIFIIIIICYNVLYLEFNHIMGRKMADAWNCFDINFKIMENTMCLSKLKDISMRVPWPLSGYRGTPFLSFSVTFLKPDNVCDSLFAVFDDDFLRAKKKKSRRQNLRLQNFNKCFFSNLYHIESSKTRGQTV